jgi:hypothetical protein
MINFEAVCYFYRREPDIDSRFPPVKIAYRFGSLSQPLTPHPSPLDLKPEARDFLVFQSDGGRRESAREWGGFRVSGFGFRG